MASTTTTTEPEETTPAIFTELTDQLQMWLNNRTTVRDLERVSETDPAIYGFMLVSQDGGPDIPVSLTVNITP